MTSALHTMDETARQLRVSRRWLQDFIQCHPYYRNAGRKKLFTAEDINRLIEAMSCPESSSLPAPAKRRSTMSAGPTSASDLTTALELARQTRRSAFSRLGVSAPNVVNFPKDGEPTNRHRQHS